jgi:tRNA threonylcarbamoyladenosine biosynthesis protein TsaB
MRVLALDTALESCSAAVVDDGRVLAAASEVMARGHQERLGPLVRSVMAEAGLSFAALDRIGVTVGPGSFTGLRVGLAFAKGLGFALSRPVIGVGTLEALAASAEGATVAAVVDARRGQLWMQVFAGGAPLMAPDALEPEVAAARLAALVGGRALTLVGSGAAMLARRSGGERIDNRQAPDPVALARLAAAASSDSPPPRPLYLRAPDAKLPGGLTLAEG